MSIKHWPTAERPRERLFSAGPSALSEAELLALFLRTGVRGRSALDLARDLRAAFGSLTELLHANPARLADLPGLGPAKAAQLAAVTELVRRGLGEQIACADALGSPAAVKAYLRLRLQHRDREVFVALFLDAQNRVLACEELFAGTLTQTSVYPREIVRRALIHNAAAVIFCHNHPSGVSEPSQSDELLTHALRKALDLVDVRVLDHFIVGRGEVMSFAERGLL
ncbi:MAG: RadC family protein [Betaproteobacteria bacterium]|jgi:DNA repair protein RadC|nr:DNA repair protein RadC [Rhodocyclaceae bacterium]MCA3134483.1 DNA repair protein RadC [Rhodocyclaceae bacterium]MCA3143951.1 DNA repair protein RadC [Rhodocyclaceae bacterium]MCA3145674.1 DNA repair protein RadC [Rhodocyclaceae bacterium]MCE2898540.1 DNA repair protein RadC [Betaproteobacteria bacterium]